MAVIDWAHTYHPRVAIGGVDFDMPLPIMQTEERYSQEFKTTKVPLQDGVVISGVSRGALTVSFSGIITKNTLSGVLHTKQRMQDIFVGSAGASFTFYRYFDEARQNFRWFPDAVCQSLTFSPTNRRIFTLEYSLTITVPGGKELQLITTTGESPGSTGHISGIIKNGEFQSDTDDDTSISNATLPQSRQLLNGPIIIKLADSAGASSFLIQNSNGDFVFRVDSDGAVQFTQPAELVASIASPF